MVSMILLNQVSTFASSEARIAATRVATTWEWYVIRAAGFVAAGLLILLMLSGIGQVTGLTYRFLEPIKAWALHKALALALCGAIAVHVTFLFLDHYIPFSIVQIFVPFASHYGNHTSLLGFGLDSVAVALGILAMYGVAIIVLSSLGWIDSKQKTWRWIHYLSYFVILAVFVHALGTGSDLRYGIFREVWILIGGVLFLAVVSRLWRVGTLRRRKDDSLGH
jgi:sulfoxide reductase heme-binding subunit YedZ